MGKPSSHQSAKKSDTSLSCNCSLNKIKTSLSTHKMEKNKRKKQNKTRNRIKKLFKKLKSQSLQSFETSQNDTVITLDTTEENNSVVIANNPVTAGQKRKISSLSIEPAKRMRNDSVILVSDSNIPDTGLNKITYPLGSPKGSNLHINCSTPISRRDSNTIRNLIINNFSSPNNITTQKINEDIVNLTKEIHRDSYLTIDLTTETDNNETNNNIVDLDKTSQHLQNDNTLISVSNTSLSMSGDSDVTVLQNKKTGKHDKQINKFANCISKLTPTEKGKLLEIIAQNIFNGCKITNDFSKTLNNNKLSISQATETEQDTFIKEVILGEVKSRNSIGSNIYHPSKDVKNKTGLRMIVIDGSNVAMEHTKGHRFSVEGLKICIDYFLRRGHVVKAFVPRFRCKYGKSTDPRLLDSLERQGLVVYTPSREIQGRMYTSYDDRYIVQCAAEFDGVIVSGDNYRDLLQENPRWRSVIENRLLQFTWVNNMIMFPKDPLGRNGPTLEQFLRHPEPGPTIVL